MIGRRGLLKALSCLPFVGAVKASSAVSESAEQITYSKDVLKWVWVINSSLRELPDQAHKCFASPAPVARVQLCRCGGHLGSAKVVTYRHVEHMNRFKDDAKGFLRALRDMLRDVGVEWTYEPD